MKHLRKYVQAILWKFKLATFFSLSELREVTEVVFPEEDQEPQVPRFS